MKKLAIDLNCDVGEAFGPYKLANDEELFPHITSANIACGFHAGDPETMRRTLELAAQHHVSVGAHPGYADRLHFGRMPLPYAACEIVDSVLYQVGALQALAQVVGLTVHHVKLHGALYYAAAEDRRLAEVLLEALVRLHPPLIIVGPPDCALQKEAEERGLDYAVEGFADRVYGEDGKLLPRSRPGALITDPEKAAEQALGLCRERSVKSVSGKKIDLKIDTLCIHGDTPGAAGIVRIVRNKLEAAKISIEPLDHFLSE